MKLGVRIRNTFGRISALGPRVLGVAVLIFGLLYIPAFVHGMVSIWLLAFSFLIAFRFRIGIENLSNAIEHLNSLKISSHYWCFFRLCCECAFYMLLPLSYFYALYVTEYWAWPAFNGFRLDDSIGFFELLQSISFADIGSPYDHPSLYLSAVTNIQAYSVLLFLFALVGVSYGKYGKNIFRQEYLGLGCSPRNLQKRYQGRMYIGFYLAISMMLASFMQNHMESYYAVIVREKEINLVEYFVTSFGEVFLPYALFILVMKVFLSFFREFSK